MPDTPGVPLNDNVPAQPGPTTRLGAWDVDDVIEVSVVLRAKPGGADLEARVAHLRAQQPEARRHLSYHEFEDMYGPAQGDVDAVTDFATANGLAVGDQNPISGTVQLRGTVASINKAFGVDLGSYQGIDASGQAAVYRCHDGAPKVPKWLDGVVEGVTGLSTRPFARPHFVIGRDSLRPMPGAPSPTPAAAQEGFTSSAIAGAYGVPKTASAKGQTVAIIELGGGYVRKDMEHYCKTLGVPMPTITDVSVDGARNSPTGGGDPATADGEVLLDMQIAAAVARSANQRVYFARNTESSFINAVAQAAKDGATAISISWGAPEAHWSKAAMLSFDRACQAAIAMGIPVFAAAGDDGSTDGLANGKQNADFPASSPHIVACGGTKMPSLDRDRETAWNDMPKGGATGGAVSDFFPVPAFQRQVTLPKSVNDGKERRTIPDVSAVAAPSTGYRIYINGHWYVFGGTSAVSPLMASMTALITHRLQLRTPGKRVGDFNALLYGAFRQGDAVRQIDDGSDNGQYKTGPGYNAVVGLGTPNFGKMLQLALSAAHVSNPPDVSPSKRPAPEVGGPDGGLAA